MEICNKYMEKHPACACLNPGDMLTVDCNIKEEGTLKIIHGEKAYFICEQICKIELCCKPRTIINITDCMADLAGEKLTVERLPGIFKGATVLHIEKNDFMWTPDMFEGYLKIDKCPYEEYYNL